MEARRTTDLDVFGGIGVDILRESPPSIEATHAREIPHERRKQCSVLIELCIWTHGTRLNEGALNKCNGTNDHLVRDDLVVVVNCRILSY